MVKLIIGPKGTGKTKRLIKEINQAILSTNGSVVCIEKEPNLRYHIPSQVRLVSVEDTSINNADRLIGYIQGICDSNYDVTDVFLDATFKIISKDFSLVKDFITELYNISNKTNVDICLTLSCNKSDLDFNENSILNTCKIIGF